MPQNYFYVAVNLSMNSCFMHASWWVASFGLLFSLRLYILLFSVAATCSVPEAFGSVAGYLLLPVATPTITCCSSVLRQPARYLKLSCELPCLCYFHSQRQQLHCATCMLRQQARHPHWSYRLPCSCWSFLCNANNYNLVFSVTAACSVLSVVISVAWCRFVGVPPAMPPNTCCFRCCGSKLGTFSCHFGCLACCASIRNTNSYTVPCVCDGSKIGTFSNCFSSMVDSFVPLVFFLFIAMVFSQPTGFDPIPRLRLIYDIAQ